MPTVLLWWFMHLVACFALICPWFWLFVEGLFVVGDCRVWTFAWVVCFVAELLFWILVFLLWFGLLLICACLCWCLFDLRFMLFIVMVYRCLIVAFLIYLLMLMLLLLLFVMLLRCVAYFVGVWFAYGGGLLVCLFSDLFCVTPLLSFVFMLLGIAGYLLLVVLISCACCVLTWLITLVFLWLQVWGALLRICWWLLFCLLVCLF